jgi:hypothetical protein
MHGRTVIQVTWQCSRQGYEKFGRMDFSCLSRENPYNEQP